MTIQISSSRQITVDAFVPHLNQHFSGRLYVPQREEQDFSDLSNKVASETRGYRQRLEELERTLSDVEDESTRSELENLRRDLDELDAKAPSPGSQPRKLTPTMPDVLSRTPRPSAVDSAAWSAAQLAVVPRTTINSS